ncbi:hypothetical protein ADG881_1905 [Alcanivorax sp. DG881]|nr:hypothetical protein ADG881_1905 [Alcanivorax sp. DG881]
MWDDKEELRARMNWNFSYVSLKCLFMKIRITTASENGH